MPGEWLGWCEHADALQRMGVDEVSECCLEKSSAGQQQSAMFVRAIVFSRR
ncbi:hypothetical protein EV14_2547 [Prochlorococcus sp. MIT 0703]|nr:hypothetical protein EV12_2326 [Prochlorococcus sp. MIT 0701]KGG31176.1 hypothetical protein EV14_2547 [Prochlorococcus sp. MIT 0703]